MVTRAETRHIKPQFRRLILPCDRCGGCHCPCITHPDAVNEARLVVQARHVASLRQARESDRRARDAAHHTETDT